MLAASACIVSLPVSNLYRQEEESKVHSRRPSTVPANKWIPDLRRANNELRDE